MTDETLASLELAIAENPEALLPWTGELVDLRDPTQVANALRELREFKNHLERLRETFEVVLRLEAQRQGTKTLHLAGIDAVISGGDRYEYDGEELLRLLEKAGMPPERVQELVQMVVTFKVNAAKAKSAAAATPAYADALERTRTVVPGRWRVTVA